MRVTSGPVREGGGEARPAVEGRFDRPFDLHVHSWRSAIRVWRYDAFPSPRAIVREAARLGLAGVAVADHNTARGSREAREAARELGLGLLALPAQEARCSRGDVLVLGLSETIERPGRLSPAELVELVRDEGGVAVAAHPFAGFWGASVMWAPLSVPFDAVEVYNAHCALLPPVNRAAERLAAKARLPGTAGSDAHLLDQLGLGITCFAEDDAGSVEGVLDALRRGRFALRTRPIGWGSYVGEWATKLRVNARWWLWGEGLG